jgi:hypothetical protein
MTSPLSTLSLTLALAVADPGFLAAVDALHVPKGEATLAQLRADTQAAALAAFAWMLGNAAGRQATTRESGRGVRAHAHAAGLPVLGGGR